MGDKIILGCIQSIFGSDNPLDIDRNVCLFIFCIYIISEQSGIKNEQFKRKQR